MSKKDILSDVFSTLRVGAELYFRAELAGGFSLEVPAEKRRIRFHLVRHGTCWLEVPGAPGAALSEGDIALVPNGARQVLSSAAGLSSRPLGEVLAEHGLTDGVLRLGEWGARASLLCGFCRFDEAVDHPALAGLPPVMVLRAAGLGAEPWLAATLRLLKLEADLDAQGTTGILGRLIEVVILQAVRRMAANDTRPPAGFAAALSDRALSRALAAIHERPQDPVTTAGLARIAGMSRARFAKRFAALVGQPPIAYLTDWRLLRARALLAGSDLAMDEIAARCGYASVPSFSRRFARRFGRGPGAYRRAARIGEESH